jgi:IS5 family transposase
MTDTPQGADFFRQPLAEMIDPRHPLVVLASRLSWARIEAALAPYFARQARQGRGVAGEDLFDPDGQPAVPQARLAALELLGNLLWRPPLAQACINHGE